MSISAIGFDLDGTLYEITPEIKRIQRRSIYEKISEYFGISVERAEYLFEKYYKETSSGRKSTELISGNLGIPVPAAGFTQEALEGADFLDLIEKNPSLIAMLERMSKRILRLDLITGSTREYALRKLERIGISSELFLYTFSHEDGSKSFPDIYGKWLSHTLLLPSQHLYVGDVPKLDVDIPRSLGIKTCIIGDYKLADFQIRNILELETLIL